MCLPTAFNSVENVAWYVDLGCLPEGSFLGQNSMCEHVEFWSNQVIKWKKIEIYMGCTLLYTLSNTYMQ